MTPSTLRLIRSRSRDVRKLIQVLHAAYRGDVDSVTLRIDDPGVGGAAS